MQPFSRDAHRAFLDADREHFGAARFAAGPHASNRDPAPVFIVGMPRSGTTLCEQNHGAAENTFVFDPGHGLDIVNPFRVHGADHDTISLPGSDFGNDIATVLKNSHNVKGSVEIIHPTSYDTVRLTGVSEAQLVPNKGDFTFHR